MQPESVATRNRTSDVLVWGEVQLNLRRMQVGVEGQWTSLTKTELELLRMLMEAKGGVVSREDLLNAIWDDTDFVDDNTLTVNVARVRRRLAVLGVEDLIHTVRGAGYQLASR